MTGMTACAEERSHLRAHPGDDAEALLMSHRLLRLPEQAPFEGRIVEDIVIGVSPAQTHAALLDVTQWPRRLPHVRGIRVTYDDSQHQEFVLELAGHDGGATTLRAVRRCTPDHIVCFHPAPPWPLKHCCEDWLIHPLAPMATHLTVVLRWSCVAAAQGVATRLRAKAKAELAAWRSSLEGWST